VDRVAEVTIQTPAARTGASRGAALIIGATAIAGVAGYLVTFVVFRAAGAAAYATFAVFWATLYLVVGGLAGIQQEITRGTHRIPVGSRTVASRARNFAALASVVVFILIVASSPLWANAVFPRVGEPLIWPLALGAGSYVLVATLAGSLYGVSQWRSLALLIATDGVLRLGLLLLALIFTRDIVALAWVVALPFPLALILLWRFIRGGIVGRSDLDVGYRQLSWNVARTVLASASTAILVSGFPLILGVAARGQSPVFIGQLIFTITLTRAPLIVTVMSLQSYFVVHFRDHHRTMWRTFAGAQLVVVGGAVVLAALGWWLGPIVLSWVSGSPTPIGGPLIALLVASSALVAALSISGSAVLAKSRHFVYSAGWFVAAVVTIAVMSFPVEFLPRVEVALVVGPIAGLVVHLGWLTLFRLRSDRVTGPDNADHIGRGQDDGQTGEI
jgi:hypothetical protein